MRRATAALIAASAVAMGLGAVVVASPADRGTRASAPSGGEQRRDVATGVSSVAVRRVERARGQWEAVRRTTSRYPTRTGSHKQNRRKQIAANRKRRR